MKINATTFTVRFVRIICKEWVGTWEKRITRTQFESFRQNANASRDKKVEEFSMVLTLKLLLFFVCSGLYLFCGIWPVYSCHLPSCFGQIIGNCAMLLGRIRRTKSQHCRAKSGYWWIISFYFWPSQWPNRSFSKNTIILFVVPPKFCISINVSISLGAIVSPKRNWKQCLCKILKRQKRVLWYFWKRFFLTLKYEHQSDMRERSAQPASPRHRNRVCVWTEAKSGMISVAAQKLSSIVVNIVKKWLSLLRSCSVANFSVSIWFFQFFIAKI